MRPELQAPDNKLTVKQPELKLRHLPLVVAYVSGVAVILSAAVFLEAAISIVAVVVIAGLLVVVVPCLFLAVLFQRRRKAAK
jgi:uncharacterized membrane protein HdeD (DUF308 family)